MTLPKKLTKEEIEETKWFLDKSIFYIPHKNAFESLLSHIEAQEMEIEKLKFCLKSTEKNCDELESKLPCMCCAEQECLMKDCECKY